MEPTRSAGLGERYAEANPRWHRTATVRDKQYAPRDEGRRWYSHSRMPFLAHPLLAGMGESEVRTLEALQLYQYLDTILMAEQLVVNPLAAKVAHGEFPALDTAGYRVGASKIYTDEAFHSQSALEFRFDIERLTGIAAPPTETPSLVTHLAELPERAPGALEDVAWLFLAGIYETQIQEDLRQSCDETLNSEVRRVLLDHAADEATHRAYFIKAMRAVWRTLPREERRTVGRLLPLFLLWCAEPSGQASLARDLALVGLDAGDVESVVRDAFPDSFGIDEAVAASGPTIELFRRMGMFEDPGTREAFAEAGVAHA